jgi:nitrite reductase/ring-hydroxylating ferredoxin subunit
MAGPRPRTSKDLAEVGPGTPMGELLRRYWHPVGLAADASATPQGAGAGRRPDPVSRRTGRPGLVYPHCAHRGTSLYYGKVEERGIRCCYHGWLFDVQGHCLDQPCEPAGANAAATRCASPGTRWRSVTA